MVACTLFRSSLKIWTMFRLEGESSNLNQYVPAGSIWPGISTGPLNVTFVSRSQVSAFVRGAKADPKAIRQTTTAIVVTLFVVRLFIFSPFSRKLRAVSRLRLSCLSFAPLWQLEFRAGPYPTLPRRGLRPRASEEGPGGTLDDHRIHTNAQSHLNADVDGQLSPRQSRLVQVPRLECLGRRILATQAEAETLPRFRRVPSRESGTLPSQPAASRQRRCQRNRRASRTIQTHASGHYSKGHSSPAAAGAIGLRPEFFVRLLGPFPSPFQARRQFATLSDPRPMRAKAIAYPSSLAPFDPLHVPRYRESRQRAVKNLPREVKKLSKQLLESIPLRFCVTIRSAGNR